MVEKYLKKKKKSSSLKYQWVTNSKLTRNSNQKHNSQEQIAILCQCISNKVIRDYYPNYIM